MLRKSKIIGSIIGLALLLSMPSFAQDLKTAIRLTESEQFDAAHKTFEALLSKEPANGDNYYYYGECWLKQFFVDSMSVSLKEVTESALKYFNVGIEKDSLDPLNYVGAGRVYILLGKNNDADIKFKKAISKLPWKNFAKDKLMPASKQALTFAEIAEAKLKSPNKTEAELLELIDKAVERSATVPEVYLIKGDIYLTFNDGSNAIVAYNRANDLDPKSCKAMVKIGQLWVKGRSYNDALGYYKDAIKIDSTFAPAYRERGELYGLAGQWENGIRDYQKFIELSGKNTYAKVRYASFLFMAKKYDEALQIINEVLTTDDGYILLYRLGAYSYYETGKYPEGLKAIVTFMKQTKPEKIITSDYTYWGDLLSKTGDDSVAIEKYKKANEMDPTNCDLLTKMAKSYLKLKEYDNNIKMFRKKIENNCATLTDYYEMGKSYYNLKQFGKADTTFGIVIDKKPDFINAVYYRAMARASIDSTKEFKGLAFTDYQNLIKLSLQDSAKYSKNLATSYGYMSYYYLKQYDTNKKCEDAKNAILYCNKILATDPKDEKALIIKKSLAGKCPN